MSFTIFHCTLLALQRLLLLEQACQRHAVTDRAFGHGASMRRLASRRSQALCGRCQRLCDPRHNVHRVALQTLAISSDFTGAIAYVGRAPRTALHRRPAASSRSHRYSPLPSTASRHRRRVVLLACQRRVTRRARRLALAAFQLGSSSGFWSKKSPSSIG